MKYEWQLEVTKWQSEKDLLLQNFTEAKSEKDMLLQNLTEARKDYRQMVSLYIHVYDVLCCIIYATQKFVHFGEKWQFVDYIYAWLYMGYLL